MRSAVISDSPAWPLIERCRRELAHGGTTATHAAWAPGRVNLIGEHVDYAGGMCLPFSIDRWCVAVGRASRGEQSVLRSLDVGEPMRLSLRGLGSAHWTGMPPWARYVAGSLRLAMGDVPFEVEACVASNVPIGAGLSSSAAVEVACVTLAGALLGRARTCREIAAIARQAEHECAGVPCGIMDQLCSACGRAGHAMCIDSLTGGVQYSPLPPRACLVMIAVDTGVRHSLSDGWYKDLPRVAREAAQSLGVAFLAEADASRLSAAEGTLPDPHARVAKHVVGETGRVGAFVRAMEQRDLRVMGDLVFASHESLRDVLGVSWPAADAAVHAARCAGALGARMIGAGRGGSVLALAHPGDAGRVRAAMLGALGRGEDDPLGFEVAPGRGAGWAAFEAHVGP